MKELNACPVFSLYAASRKLIKIYTKELEKLEVTYPQYLVISCLLDKDACSVDEIGSQIFLDSGTLTPLLKRLEANGLIKREHSTEDERKRVISLTSKGRKFQNLVDTIRQRISTKVSLSKDEVHQLVHLLHKILKAEI